MSMVRFLVYSNEFDVEGLVAVTSTWMRNRVRPDVIRTVIDAYAQVRPNLLAARSAVSGARGVECRRGRRPAGFGMAAVGADKMSDGAALIIRAADKADARPLWMLACGAEPTRWRRRCSHVRDTRTPEQLDAFVAKLRVYSISDQDDAGPWIRREFPPLHYIAMPSTPDGEQYYQATWTGISGDRFYKNAPGADFTTFTDDWVNAEHPQQGAARQAVSVPLLHSRRRHAVVSRPDRQRPRQRHEPDLWRVGRPLRLAPVLRRDAADLDAGRRFVPRQGQFEDTVIGVDGKAVHVGPGDDLAMADGVSTRLRRAHGLDDQGRRAREPQPRRRRERSAAARRRSAIDARVGAPTTLDAAGTSRSGWQRADVHMVLLSGSRHGHSRTSGRDRARACRSAAAARPRPEAFRRHQAAARASRRRGSRSRTRPPPA